ncbi:hypothetical protein NESM_000069300 [Novymonas esmeraldas]|uniref:Uncharacterized protein n=1 Tax=Novymonas esmeraldas TaxID=1808958 RepID=A0AAW0F237_9TRYP
MLSRQALWVPLVQHSPTFTDVFAKFLHNNPITSLNVAAMGLKPEEARVALEPDARSPGKMVVSMMAFPLRVSAAACDVTADQQRRELTFGFATAVCDSCNSIHVIERLLPALNPHVSVNIQSQCARSLVEGEKVVVVSTVDKLGKRLVYCKTWFLAEPTEPVPEEVVQREKGITTVAELRAALAYYETVVTSAHVKSIMADRKIQ